MYNLSSPSLILVALVVGHLTFFMAVGFLLVMDVSVFFEATIGSIKCIPMQIL